MKTVLIITNQHQKNVPYICKHLDSMHQNYAIIDTTDLSSLVLALSCTQESKKEDYFICNERQINVSSIQSVLCRGMLYSTQKTGSEMQNFMLNEFLQTLWSFSTNFKSYWMNPPLTSKFLLDHNKLYQLETATKLGLNVPETLVSNNSKELVAFCDKHGGEIAVKTVKSRVFQSEDGGVEAIYTNVVNTETLKKNEATIRLAPMMAQQYIPKKIELRVTVVGEKFFTCAIHSQDSQRTKHDWRKYDIEKVKHQPYELDESVKRKIRRMMSFWKLNYAAIDMIITPDDQIYFLEINPNGQFGWIEALTSMPITRTIAEALSHQ